MGACATKPGDLKVKGEAPLAVEDAVAAPVVAADEKAAKAGEVPVPAAVETVDQADVSRRRSLSVLLKQDAEASDGEADADHQEAEKVMVVAEEPATAAAAEETMGSPEAPVQASVATTEHDDTAEEQELKDGDLPSGDAHAAEEEEKRVDPESVQVAVTADPAADADADAAASSSEESKQIAVAAPSSEESRQIAVAADAAPSSEESKHVADDDGASA